MAQPRTPFTVLVIDDDSATLDLVELLLKDEYRVVRAGSGPAGIEAAKEHHPHLILLDFYMTEMDGVECVAALKANATTSTIPVVALTATHAANALVAAGCVGYIPKPLDPRTFTKDIGELLRATVARRPRLWQSSI